MIRILGRQTTRARFPTYDSIRAAGKAAFEESFLIWGVVTIGLGATLTPSNTYIFQSSWPVSNLAATFATEVHRIDLILQPWMHTFLRHTHFLDNTLWTMILGVAIAWQWYGWVRYRVCVFCKCMLRAVTKVVLILPVYLSRGASGGETKRNHPWMSNRSQPDRDHELLGKASMVRKAVLLLASPQISPPLSNCSPSTVPLRSPIMWPCWAEQPRWPIFPKVHRRPPLCSIH